MARFLWFVLCISLICGCAVPEKSATQPPANLPKPSDGPPISETAAKSPIPLDQVKLVLDLEEYPGAYLAENHKLSSKEMSPDEVRLELVRTSGDKPDKVVAYFEEKLSVKALGSDKGKEIFGRTKRGNFVRVHVNADGKGSKFTLNVISYTK